MLKYKLGHDPTLVVRSILLHLGTQQLAQLALLSVPFLHVPFYIQSSELCHLFSEAGASHARVRHRILPGRGYHEALVQDASSDGNHDGADRCG